MKRSVNLEIHKQGIFLRRILPGIAFLFLLSVFPFSLFYLSSGYEKLVAWFFDLNSCFYKHNEWTTLFFTPATKHAGDLYCILAMVLSLVCAGMLFKSLRNRRPPSYKQAIITIPVGLKESTLCVLLLLVATISWLWGGSLVYPSNDEVFSAVNCASLHPFQTMSYYMLPNNHILFNLLNNLLFHAGTDKVASGRDISLVCYLGVLVMVFSWLRSMIGNVWLVFAILLTASLQFPVWGFATQARGYELLLLAEWGALISLVQFHFTQQKRWLYMLAIAVVAGYFTVPSFLYFHAALLLFSGFYQIYSRMSGFRFWMSQAAALAVVFMLYLPCLCFSGLSAIAGNQYVAAYQNSPEFLADLMPMLHNYMDYCFFNFITPAHQLDYLLFLSPLMLFLFRQNKLARTLGLVYISILLSIILLTLKMRIYPFDRSLAGQFSVIFVIVLYTYYLLFEKLASLIKLEVLKFVMLPLLLLALSINFLQKGRLHITHYLCHFPVNDWHNLMLNTGVKQIPKGSSVGTSSESFYLFYLLSQNGYKATQCSTALEDYYININEPFPLAVAQNYTQFGKVGDYFIYKRKQKAVSDH